MSKGIAKIRGQSSQMILHGVTHKKRRRRYHKPKLKFIVLGNFSLLIFFLVGFNLIMVGTSLSDGEKPITHDVRFSLCKSGPHYNCVSGGDTFYLGYQKIRVAGIDTPHPYSLNCAQEEELSNRATQRIAQLLNYGPFFMKADQDQDVDEYGQIWRTIHRKDYSLGEVLISEGLAKEWNGQRQPWCT